jgi:act minimal PKS ketosynthase (KS/KS alpha)
LSRVVVTGMHCITAAGFGLDALWGALTEGRGFGARIRKFDVSQNASQIGAEIDGFDPILQGIDPALAARTDRATQLAIVCSRHAVRDAGLGTPQHRGGVCIGSAIGGVEIMERAFRRACVPGSDKPKWVKVRRESLAAPVYGAFLAASISTEIARDQAYTGPCTTMATGCVAGLDAIGTAASMIESGMADIMITGGVDAPVTPIVLTSFDNIKALTRRNSDPTKASRPFDRERDGFLLAEGCAVLILEAEEFARRRGARIYGTVLGYASTSNAYHMTGLPVDGESLALAIKIALARAGVDPGKVDYINAHGSSTPQNDRGETAAFKRVFGERVYGIPISSTKSCIGHTLGAASAIESAVCFMALTKDIVPPTLNYENACPDCDLDYVPNEPRNARLRVVENNASGFSGIHSAAVFGHPDGLA